MADAKTLMSLSLKDEATKQLKGFESNYRKTMQSIEGGGGAGDGMANVVANVGSMEGAMTLLGASAPQVAAAMAMIGAAGAAADWARQAGEVQILRASFDDLAAGAGQSSQQMLQAMRQASGGMISDANLIQAANKAMLLGVADTGGELASLLEVARSRGAAMGLSVTQAFSDIVTGLGRESALILDNLGITMDVTKVMADYAASVGTTADKLDSAQRKQALLNEVMRQSAGLETPVENAATAWQRASAAMENAKMALGELFGPAVAAAMNLTASAATTLADAVNTEGIAQAKSVWLEYVDQVDAATQRLNDLEQLQRQIGNVEPAFLPPNLQQFDAGDINKQIAAVNGQIAALNEAANAARKHYLELQGLTEVSARTRAETEALTRAAWAGVASWGDFSAGARDAKAAADQAAMGLSAMARVAAAGAADVATLEAAVAGLNARMAGMQPILASVTQMRQSAIGQAESLGLQAIAEGADPTQVAGMVAQVSAQIWDMGLSYDATTEAQFMNRVEVTQSTASLQEYVEGLRKANTAASTFASSGLKQVDQALEDLRGKVGSVLSGSLSLDAIGVNPSDFLPRPDAVQEDAFRLADVMVKGFASPWAAYFESEFPALFQEMTAGGDIQAGAAAVLQQFQQGLRPELLNFDAIKEQVKQALVMDDALAAIRDQITAELTGAGATAGQVQGALDQVLGGLGKSKTADVDLSATGASAAQSFVSGFGDGAKAEKFVSAWVLSMGNQFVRIYNVGVTSGEQWGRGFLTSVETGVPAALIGLLTALITPEVLARIRQQQTQAGALP
jgi:hypothetical protein